MPAGLLGIEELDRAEIASILARAKDFQPMQSQSLKKLDTLRGKMIVNLFYEASTRTRTSFEIAAKRMGADAVSITASGSSVSKGESLVDTLNTLGAMRPDAIVMRHAASGANGAGQLGQLRDGPAVRAPGRRSPARRGLSHRCYVYATDEKPASGAGCVRS